MIYKRNHSIEVDLGDYQTYFGSVADAKKRCFNIGAGKWQHEAWTNIDLPPQSEAFAKIQAPCIYHDLVESDNLPIESGSAELIYTSHVVEHLPDANVDAMFSSVYKSLRQGGVFRVVTGPDADTDYAALIRQDKHWWYFYNNADFVEGIAQHGPMSLTDKWLFHVATARSIYSKTPCKKKYTSVEVEALLGRYPADPDKVRQILTAGLIFNRQSPGDHLSWWNGDKLIQALKDAGFNKVQKSAYGQSHSYFMRDMNLFDLTYPQISIYVEAVK
jgi:hypothetical protein